MDSPDENGLVRYGLKKINCFNIHQKTGSYSIVMTSPCFFVLLIVITILQCLKLTTVSQHESFDLSKS